jgi:hypothetical protein
MPLKQPHGHPKGPCRQVVRSARMGSSGDSIRSVDNLVDLKRISTGGIIDFDLRDLVQFIAGQLVLGSTGRRSASSTRVRSAAYSSCSP